MKLLTNANLNFRMEYHMTALSTALSYNPECFDETVFIRAGDYMAITLRDVAAKAGVSMKTVSRVVNNEKEISEETRERVRQVIDAMGYVPHEQARRLAGGKSRSITLHFPLSHADQIANPLELNFVIGTALGAAESNYFFSLLTGQMTHASLLQLTRSAQTDGLVLMQINMDDWRVNFLKEQQYPFVMIGHGENTEGSSFIDFDFESAVQMAYLHLIELGHRNIGFLTYSEHQREMGFGPATRAMHGFNAAVEQHGLHPVYLEVDASLKETYAAALAMLETHPDLTAIVTMYHTMSIGALKALQKLGRSVPDNCSLLAVGSDREAELVIPPLTGVTWDTQDAGYQAAQLLIRSIEDKDSDPEQILVAPSLIIRESTAPLRR
jgi:DNA-binding LacI/PurR family transcriptional regulator